MVPNSDGVASTSRPPRILLQSFYVVWVNYPPQLTKGYCLSSPSLDIDQTTAGKLERRVRSSDVSQAESDDWFFRSRKNLQGPGSKKVCLPRLDFWTLPIVIGDKTGYG